MPSVAAKGVVGVAFVGLVGLEISFYRFFAAAIWSNAFMSRFFVDRITTNFLDIKGGSSNSNVWGCWVACMSLALNSWLCILWDGSKTTPVCGRSLFMFLEDTCMFVALLNLWLLTVAEKIPHFLILKILPSDLLISIISRIYIFPLLRTMQFYPFLTASRQRKLSKSDLNGRFRAHEETRAHPVGLPC